MKNRTNFLGIAFLILTVIGSSSAMAKAFAWDHAYVTTMGEQGAFYARCIPEEKKGGKGITQIFLVKKEGDELVTTYDWYNRSGLVLGWSPKAGKVAVMRIRQEDGLPPEKQIELSFYLGDKLLKSYTTTDLIKLGAILNQTDIDTSVADTLKHVQYHDEGCKQVPNTNDYYFQVRLNESKTLCFDILTGKLCRIEGSGVEWRMVLDEVAK